MAKVRPLEVKAILPLLEQDWPDELFTNKQGKTVLIPGEERLAEALIQALDEVRASRVSYIGVMQFGRITFGIGPYPGRKSAQNALLRHPGLSLMTAVTIAEIVSPEGFEQKMKELDAPPKKKSA